MAEITAAQAEKIIAHLEQTAAASLAGGIIAASGRAYSLEQAMEILRDVHFALFPEPGHGSYDVWAKDPNRFKKTYS